jgi:acetyl esterase/lipase
MSKLHIQNQDVRFAIAAMRLTMNRLAEMRPRGLRSRSEIIAGIPCEWVWSRETENSAPITLCLHGGGYVAGSPASHFMLGKLLSRASRSRILMVDYRLSPEHQYPAQLDDALTVYRALLDRGVDTKNLALVGDSAGGNLSLALMLRLRELNLPLPVAFVAYSPWTDLTHSGESIARNAERDVAIPVAMLAPLAQMYAGENDLRDPLISPLFGDYAGLPPMQLHAAQDEVLLDDTLRLAEKAKAAGIEVQCHVWKNVMHAFPVFAELIPEGRTAIAQSGEFLRRHFAAIDDSQIRDSKQSSMSEQLL